MKQLQVFVLAAQIAAQLNTATQVAQQLSLTAKNARAIASRAGLKAMGFRAIIEFIEEMAANTIEQASAINQIALQISIIATSLERANHAASKFRQVRAMAPDAEFIDSIVPMEEQTQLAVERLQATFKEQRGQLSRHLEDAQKHIRSASIISSTSKVEASDTEDYQQHLLVIAANIDTAASTIKQHLHAASKLLQLIDQR